MLRMSLLVAMAGMAFATPNTQLAGGRSLVKRV